MAESEANVVYSPMARREDFRRPPDSSAHREIVRERASFWDSFFDKWKKHADGHHRREEEEEEGELVVSDDEDWEAIARTRRDGMPGVTRMQNRAFKRHLRETMQDDEIQSILSSPSFEEHCEEDGPVEDLGEEEEEEEEEDLSQEEGETTLTGDIVEPLMRVDLNRDAAAPPQLVTFNGADDEVCALSSPEYSSATAKRPPLLHASPLSALMKEKRPDGREESEEEEEEPDRPESPFYVPTSGENSMCSPSKQPRRQLSPSALLVSPDAVVETLQPLSRTRDFFTTDEVGESPSLEGGKEVVEEESVYVQALDCHRCGGPSFLPAPYWENMSPAPFLCDRCMVESTGHSDCVVPDCGGCRATAAVLCKRAIIRKNFLDGTLEIEEVEEEEEQLEAT